MRRALSLLVVTVTLVVAGCGGDDAREISDNQRPPSDTPASAADDSAEAEATEAPVGTSAGSAGDSAGGCADVEAPEPHNDGGATSPTEPLDAERTWTLTFDTSCGTFVVTLDLDSAPETAASLVALAEDGFYDDTVFHRIVPGFVIQGGDPTQSGSGGPGYKTVDPPAADAAYVRGVVAMAKTAQEPAGTSGSQFFVVTGADVGLTPDYAIVGEVTQGLDVVDLIGTMGDPATEEPIRAVVVESVTAELTP